MILADKIKTSGAKNRVSATYNDVLYIGPRFYSYGYISFAKFQNNGNELLIQNYAGEVVLNLSNSYDVSSGVTYKNGTANWINADKYSNASYNAAGSLYSAVCRFDIQNDKVYKYNPRNNKTEEYSGINSYTNTSLIIENSATISAFDNCGQVHNTLYVEKSDGSISILFCSSTTLGIINYYNDTTTVADSYSQLDISDLPINFIYNIAISLDGQKVSIYYKRNSDYKYNIKVWDLSTAFDLTTANSPVEYNDVTNSVSSEYGSGVRTYEYDCIAAWDKYGAVKVLSWTVDGDLSTFSIDNQISRNDLGYYRNCCSTYSYFDNGNYLINYGYTGTSYVFGPLSTPYQWEWQDGGFTPRGGYFTYIASGKSDTKAVPVIQDGQLDLNKNNVYSGLYSSTFKIYQNSFGTANDPTTITPNYTGESSVELSEWTEKYQNYSLWVDRDSNKVHMVNTTSDTGSYVTAGINTSNGTMDGIYETPSNYVEGTFKNKAYLQPLSSDGSIFIYYENSKIWVIELNTPYNPIDGWNVLGSVLPAFLLPNGDSRLITSAPKIYVQNQTIFVCSDKNNKTAKIDVLIDDAPVS